MVSAAQVVARLPLPGGWSFTKVWPVDERSRMEMSKGRISDNGPTDSIFTLTYLDFIGDLEAYNLYCL